MGTRNAEAIIERLARRAGIDKHVSPHMFRSSYATGQLVRGFTVREVQELLGHFNLATTAVYLSVSPEALRKKVQGGGKAIQEDKRAALVGEVAALQEKLSALARQVEELEVGTQDVRLVVGTEQRHG